MAAVAAARTAAGTTEPNWHSGYRYLRANEISAGGVRLARSRKLIAFQGERIQACA
jgi:hypothetical protein